MGEYTDQEIEMLARHMWDTNVFAPSWDEAAPSQREQARSCVRRGTEAPRISEAAVRLMREARKQGAAEMQDRAIAALRALPDGTWGDERGEMSPWPDAIAAVKALKVPQ